MLQHVCPFAGLLIAILGRSAADKVELLIRHAVHSKDQALCCHAISRGKALAPTMVHQLYIERHMQPVTVPCFVGCGGVPIVCQRLSKKWCSDCSSKCSSFLPRSVRSKLLQARRNQSGEITIPHQPYLLSVRGILTLKIVTFCFLVQCVVACLHAFPFVNITQPLYAWQLKMQALNSVHKAASSFKRLCARICRHNRV